MPKKAARGWKIRQLNHKKDKMTKLALIILALLITLLLLSQAFRFVKLLTHPLNSEINSKKYSWSGEFNLNFIAATNPISLVSYNPEEKEVKILTIPDQAFIDVPDGFGKWQIRSIFDLGETSEIGGFSLLKKSISEFLGIPIDGISSKLLVDRAKHNIFSGIELLPGLKTDLTGWELILLKASLLQVRFDKMSKVRLEDLLVLEKQTLADGTEVFIADPIRLDSVMRGFADPKISSEHLSIAVFNTTEKPLLAQKAKRLIENLGGNVIVAQNAPRILEKSYVEGVDSKTLKRLIQIFDLGCSQKCDKIPKEDLGVLTLRAQIIVVLGQDF